MSLADKVRQLALSLVGQDYHWGEEPWYVIGQEATKVKLDTDCSGLPYGVFRKAGVLLDGKPLPTTWRWTANGLYKKAQPIDKPSRVGDLGFLLTAGGHAFHTFVYVGRGPNGQEERNIVEAGDGTGRVGAHTVTHENSRGAVWGRLNTNIGELTEDDMNELQDELLKLNRLSHVADSWWRKKHDAFHAAAPPGQIEQIVAAGLAAVEAERVRLGLPKGSSV